MPRQHPRLLPPALGRSHPPRARGAKKSAPPPHSHHRARARPAAGAICRWVREELTAADRAAYNAAWASVLATNTPQTSATDLNAHARRHYRHHVATPIPTTHDGVGSGVAGGAACEGRGGLWDLAAAARRVAAAAAQAHGGEDSPLLQRLPTTAAGATAAAGAAGATAAGAKAAARAGGGGGGGGAAGATADSLEGLLLQAKALSPLLRRKALDLLAAALASATEPSSATEPGPLSGCEEDLTAAAAGRLEHQLSPGAAAVALGDPALGGAEAFVRGAVGGGVWVGGVKGTARAMEKLLRSYECDPARLTDVCRQVTRAPVRANTCVCMRKAGGAGDGKGAG